MAKNSKKTEAWIKYYDERDVLSEVLDESVDLVVDKRLRADII